jgi:hypothetical protein
MAAFAISSSIIRAEYRQPKAPHGNRIDLAQSTPLSTTRRRLSAVQAVSAP